MSQNSGKLDGNISKSPDFIATWDTCQMLGNAEDQGVTICVSYYMCLFVSSNNHFRILAVLSKEACGLKILL